VFAIGLVIGIVGWYFRAYVNAPVWVLRALWADHSDIYLGKTNGMPNRALVDAARQYLKQFTQIEVNGKTISASQFETLGIYLKPAWFFRHHPDSVDYNPFAPADQGNFTVTWTYAPGCQSVIKKISNDPRSNWFDIKGQPCFGTYSVAVFMAPNLKLTKIRLRPNPSR